MGKILVSKQNSIIFLFLSKFGQQILTMVLGFVYVVHNNRSLAIMDQGCIRC